MPDPVAQAYSRAFVARCREARARTDLTQEEMAAALGIGQGKYKQYETRTMLPHRFIPAFCAITGVSEYWLLSGKQRHRHQDGTKLRTIR